MNHFDEKYEIRLAKKDDVPRIMTFLHEHWKQNHILAKDKKLFEYEFVYGNRVNFILAINRETREIEGIFGFINSSHPDRLEKKDLWGSLWKVVDTRENIPFLGVELAKRVYSLTNCRMHIGNGANPKTTILFRKRFFKDKTTKMQHFYMLNPTIENFEIAVIEHYRHSPLVGYTEKYKLRILKTIEEVQKCFDIESLDAIPYKDSWYLNKRYFQHPYYKYTVYGIESSDGVKALIITKEVQIKKRAVLRIVDYIGEHAAFSQIGQELQKLMRRNEYEYIDFYVWGIKEELILQAGFTKREENDPNIIPNYFEPFSQQNVDVWVHYQDERTTFFKADGDQDRPNNHREKLN